MVGMVLILDGNLEVSAHVWLFDRPKAYDLDREKNYKSD